MQRQSDGTPGRSESNVRSKKALLNTVTGLAYEAVSVICGLVLPFLILGSYGSRTNGITQAIAQFLSCIALMKAGIGGVTRAALYKALAKNDIRKISAIVRATSDFMKKIAMVFVVLMVVFAVGFGIYMQYFVEEQDRFDFWYTVSLVGIISIGTFGEYFFGFTYEMLLNADQRQCVFSIIRIFTTILNTVVAVILINSGCGIHWIKLGSALVFLINPIVINLYAKRKYKLIKNIEPDKSALRQRWDALGHEVANFVNTNTDIMVLTFCAPVERIGLVSVYTVYNMIILGMRKLINTFINGFGAAFGNMYARKEYELMEKNFRIYELIVFSLVSVLYSVMTVMFVSFAMLYAEHDKAKLVELYNQPVFAMIISLAGAFSCIRIPYQNIVTVAGHFKQTRNGAFMEAILNIVISVVCVFIFGLVGVAIGTLAANLFRTIQYVLYMSRNVLKRSIKPFISHTLVFVAILVLTNVIARLCFNVNAQDVLSWVIASIETVIVAVVLTLAADILLYNDDLKRLLTKVKRMMKTIGKKSA